MEALEELVGKRPGKDEGEQRPMKEDVMEAPVGKTELKFQRRPVKVGKD